MLCFAQILIQQRGREEERKREREKERKREREKERKRERERREREGNIKKGLSEKE